MFRDSPLLEMFVYLINLYWCIVCFPDPYDNRDIYTSLNIAWELLEAFPPQELKQIQVLVLNNQ